MNSGDFQWRSEREYWAASDHFGSKEETRILGDVLGQAESLKQGLPVVEQLEPILSDRVEAAVASVYPAYRDDWAEGTPVSLSEFRRAVTLTCLMVFEDGTVDLCLRDGGHFGGHTVVAGLDRRLEFTEAHISG